MAGRPAIPDARFSARIDRARTLASAREIEALLIGSGADLRYLTGYDTHPNERLTLLVLPARGPSTLVAPRLEAMAAEQSPAARAGAIAVAAWDETDDPHALVARLLDAAMPDGVGARPTAANQRHILVSDQLWAMQVLALERALPDARLGLASTLLRELRMAKDPEEVELLRAAAHAADRVLAQIAAGPLVGRTEADVSREIRARLVAEGHDEAWFAIVASGPNSASPHHDAGDRVIEAGEPIVVDIGGTFDGYSSDTTRTLWVTGHDPERLPTPDFLELYAVLQDAQAEATSAVRPGVPAERIDGVARGIIEAGGHGPEFIHRVGHGIGLETHEEPYLVAGNAEPLRPGVAFSVEPGIYVAGRHGARIEDIVVCTADGPDVLNESRRDLWVVPG